MRIIASLTLAIATAVSVPVSAMDFVPIQASQTGMNKGGQFANSPSGGTASAQHKRYTVHRRVNRVVPVSAPGGLIITDFKPDDSRLYAQADYLLPKTDDATFAETNVAPIRLHKAGVRVKYRF